MLFVDPALHPSKLVCGCSGQPPSSNIYLSCSAWGFSLVLKVLAWKCQGLNDPQGIPQLMTDGSQWRDTVAPHPLVGQSWGIFLADAQWVPRGIEPSLPTAVPCSTLLALFGGRQRGALSWPRDCDQQLQTSAPSGSTLVPELSHLRSCASWETHIWQLREMRAQRCGHFGPM